MAKNGKFIGKECVKLSVTDFERVSNLVEKTIKRTRLPVKKIEITEESWLSGNSALATISLDNFIPTGKIYKNRTGDKIKELSEIKLVLSKDIGYTESVCGDSEHWDDTQFELRGFTNGKVKYYYQREWLSFEGIDHYTYNTNISEMEDDLYKYLSNIETFKTRN